MSITCDIFVYVQKYTSVALELLGEARRLAQQDQKVCALVFGGVADRISEEYSKELFGAGADKIYDIINEKLDVYNCQYCSEAAVQLIERENPYIILIGATHQGRDLAPRISTRLNTGLTADCTKLELIEYKDELRLAATRPTFGGQLMATILCKTNPQMATVRENVLKKLEYSYSEEGKAEEFRPNLDNVVSGTTFIEFIEDTAKNTDELEGAKIILAGGKGLNKEGFEKLEELAKKFNDRGLQTAVGASRKAVDSEMASQCCQVGQTGKTVAPKIYVAFGISGAVQHLSGMQNSDFVIAVNSDPGAPIFKYCDVGVVGDAGAILAQMCEM